MELTGHSQMKLKICNCITVLQFFPAVKSNVSLSACALCIDVCGVVSALAQQIGAGEMDRLDNGSNDSLSTVYQGPFQAAVHIENFFDFCRVSSLLCCLLDDFHYQSLPEVCTPTDPLSYPISIL